MSEILAIGSVQLDDSSNDEIAFVVTYKSSRKVETKAGDGDDDGTTTRKGREPRDITIKLSWPDREEVNARAAEIIKQLDACNVAEGDPPAYAHERNGLDFSSLKSVRNIEIKETKGPDSVAGSGVNTYEISAVSWVKPKPKATPAAGKTPTGGAAFTEPGAKAKGGPPIQQGDVVKKPGVPTA